MEEVGRAFRPVSGGWARMWAAEPVFRTRWHVVRPTMVAGRAHAPAAAPGLGQPAGVEVRARRCPPVAMAGASADDAAIQGNLMCVIGDRLSGGYSGHGRDLT